eukprot:662678-Prorocentrum_minimum.AAC.2
MARPLDVVRTRRLSGGGYYCWLLLSLLCGGGRSAVMANHAARLLPADREALVSFRTAVTARPNTYFNWYNETADPCDNPAGWQGVLCTPPKAAWGDGYSRVTRLKMHGFNLTAKLSRWNIKPGALQHLEELDLSMNVLTGPIPASFQFLSNLQILSLAVNCLTGTIPSELGKLQNLETLNLDGGFTPEQVIIQPW